MSLVTSGIFIILRSKKTICTEKIKVILYSLWERFPLRLREGLMPMSGYVSYSDLIQIGILVVAFVGLIYEISHKEKNNRPRFGCPGGYLTL